MFLDVLNKDEKEWFMDLAIKAAEANGEFAKEEVRMLHAFATEMKIPARIKSERDLDSILKDFVDNSSKKSMKVVLFELIGIIFADSEFDDAEKKFIDTVTNAFQISSELKDEMISEINEYSSLFNKICNTVLQ